MESRGHLKGRSEEGQTQGSPEAGFLFAVSIQKYLVKLDRSLADAGGFARAGWDDIYALGPPDVVFPSLDVFWQEVGEHCGLERQRAKCKVYSSSATRPATMPEDLLLAGDRIDGVFEPGFLCYGAMIGSEGWVAHKLDLKVKEVAEKARKVSTLLREERQGLWTILRGSLKFQFEYWLGLQYPSTIRAAARRLDTVLQEVLEVVAGQHIPLVDEGLGWEESLEVPVAGLTGRSFQCWLLGLPIRHRGLGLTRQEDLSPIAFIGSVEQALAFYGGETGVCPPLDHMVGSMAETRYTPLLASNCRTGQELRLAWERVRGEARECCDFLGRELEVPLAVALEGLGGGLNHRCYQNAPLQSQGGAEIGHVREERQTGEAQQS